MYDSSEDKYLDDEYFKDGYFKDIEVRINMKVFMRGDDNETSYEEKEEHVANLVKHITKDKDIVEVYYINVLDIF